MSCLHSPPCVHAQLQLHFAFRDIVQVLRLGVLMSFQNRSARDFLGITLSLRLHSGLLELQAFEPCRLAALHSCAASMQGSNIVQHHVAA